ncbi:DBF4-type zinc finger-containing protein 2 homolog [Phalacrocorax carbo]|uniref:DBF4-type zinc finger-containing protein 2 homolog n=1 Tax=Phalacrocorax carbo TaxID=9209 RepID=UPI00311A8210
MHYCKGDSDQDLCHDGSVCGEKGWTWHGSGGCCHEIPVGTADLPPCHDPGSLSRDIEGSCQSEPQGCQPTEPCPPQSCCPPQQSCNFGKPRRRVEVSHVQPVCPPPVKIHRRPLQQYRPPLHCEEPACCGKPRRRVEQCPTEDSCPPVIPLPQPLQRCSPCIPCCCPPIQRCCPPIKCCCPPVQRCCPPIKRCCPPVQRCCPATMPLPLHPNQQQQKQVPLLPPCLQKK